MNVHSPKLPTNQPKSLPEQRNISYVMLNSSGAGTFSPASRAGQDRCRSAARLMLRTRRAPARREFLRRRGGSPPTRPPPMGSIAGRRPWPGAPPLIARQKTRQDISVFFSHMKKNIDKRYKQRLHLSMCLIRLFYIRLSTRLNRKFSANRKKF